jgi:hypothetical protein
MLQLASALPGLVIHASDGTIGTVSDLLFDDRTWALRWLVAETGGWLPGRKLRLHPSAVTHAGGRSGAFFVTLTRAALDTGTLNEDGDPHLRSAGSIRNYHILGSDGAIGHVENFLIDPASWAIRYLIIETRHWWPGEHVLISPRAVTEMSWPDHQLRLAVTRAQIKAAPKWDPAAAIDEFYEQQLHGHYGWPNPIAGTTHPPVTQ